jgi:hypothetical protein
MRLKASEKNAILRQAARFAPGGESYLFGSRTNPASRGGDIDLLLLTDDKLPLRKLRAMRRAILGEIGEQKLDIVNFPRHADHPFKDLALAGGVRL